jgi:exonuclease III
MDRRMDENPTGSRFSKKGERVHNAFFDAILNLGFKDCLRKSYPDFIETYRHHIEKNRYPWELDHMFATPQLYERLKKIEVVMETKVKKLSDHNPLVADFD